MTSRPVDIDRESLLVGVEGSVDLFSLERSLNDAGLTLSVDMPSQSLLVSLWLARGAPGSRDRWLDPVDHLVAGLDATFADGRTHHIALRPSPRRAGRSRRHGAPHRWTGGRFGRIDRAWLRVHGPSATPTADDGRPSRATVTPR